MLKNRILQARKKAGLTQTELARKIGVSPASIAHLESGRSQTSKNIGDLAKALNVSLEWLLYDHKTNIIPILKDYHHDNDMIDIHHIDQNELTFRFMKSKLDLYNVSYHDAICMTMQDNSMYPIIPKNAILGIDKSKKKIISGDIYAILVNDEVFIKLIYNDFDNIRLVSYNNMEYPLKLVTMNDIEIIGRIFWWSVMI